MTAKRLSITADRLRHVLAYDANTGMFTWRNPNGTKVKSGDRAGFAHSAGYLTLCVDSIKFAAHQAAWLYMTGAWPEGQIDHRNGDRSDNRWDNLRQADQQHNSANMRRRHNNKSGFKGVVKISKIGWGAYIHVNGETTYLGSFPSPEEASAAYEQAARSVWGEYARAA